MSEELTERDWMARFVVTTAQLTLQCTNALIEDPRTSLERRTKLHEDAQRLMALLPPEARR